MIYVFTLALKYIGDREHALRVFLADPRVPLDTNHVERSLRRRRDPLHPAGRQQEGGVAVFIDLEFM